MFPMAMEEAVIKACQKGNAVNPIKHKILPLLTEI